MPAKDKLGRRLALIIGCPDYYDQTLQQLRAPGQDACDLAEVLGDPTLGGFDVDTVIDTPSHELSRRIERFFCEAEGVGRRQGRSPTQLARWVQPLHPRGRGRRPAAARPGARPRRRHSDRAGRRQARPAHDRRATRGQGAAGLRSPAAFSGPYTVAAALLGGGLGVSHEDFTDAAARDPPSPWPPWCAASRTSAAARRSRTPSPPSCA